MESNLMINKRVRVLAIYADGKNKNMPCHPIRMIYQGKEYTFTETGLIYPTVKGKRMVHIFDMTDSQADYRLEFDAENLIWTLISISDSYYAAWY